MTVELLAEDGSVRDVVKKRIGIRTLTISQEKDRWGQEFAFIVNGVKIFTRVEIISRKTAVIRGSQKSGRNIS